MPSITNVGGSLTSAIALTLLAWGVRVLRATALNNQRSGSRGMEETARQLGRFFFTLSPAALRMLVETNPIPHLVVDIRSAEQVEAAPLPAELSGAVHIPEAEVEEALAEREGAWPHRLAGVAAPEREAALVFVGESQDSMRAAAAAASYRGYQRVATLEGGLPAFARSAHTQADLKYVSRDAVAVLLGLAGPADAGLGRALVLDVRRHDERTLYGNIPGTLHLPSENLGAALRMTAAEWEAAHHFPRPQAEETVVMQSRTCTRAAWAAQLAKDVGLTRCFVYRQGTYGWHLDPAVKSYRRYERWEPPPEPEPFQVEAVDAAAVREELAQLGL